MNFLPGLIRVRRQKGVIRPQYASEDYTGLARTLVQVYVEHLEKTRGELREALGSCEELGFDFKLVRGLSAVLEDRCIFQSRAVVPPVEARTAVFEEAAGRMVATEEERMHVLSAVAFRMGVSVIDLDRSLYADLIDEQELSRFEEVTPQDLLKEYNFALVVALLVYARRLVVSFSGDDRGMVELCGRLGECSVSGSGEKRRIAVELGSARRSGYSASLLEEVASGLMSRREWSLVADVAYPVKAKKVYRLEVSSGREGRAMKVGYRGEEQLVVSPARQAPTVGVRGEIVVLESQAARLGVTEAEVSDELLGRGFVDLGGVMVARGRLEAVEEALASAPDMRFDTVREILKGQGCRDPVPLLEALGYVVEWNRDRSQSMVYRLGKHRLRGGSTG
ncbi:MAG: DUF790 family protein [Candidatus Bathyarchaeota archaeon]|nr:MAG: DUF790 family protein [Candidatus Bathyarchaeota archaeon]